MPKKMKIPEFCRLMVAQGISRPTDIKTEFERKYPSYKNSKGQLFTIDAFIKGCNRQKITKEIREQTASDIVKKQQGRDICEYDEFKSYVLIAERGRVQQSRIKHVAKLLRELHGWMNFTDPHTWTYTAIINAIDLRYPMVINSKDQKVYSEPAAVMTRLGAINTVFKGIIPENFSAGLTRPAGELKDFFTFAEFELFIENCQSTLELSQKGWRALFTAQINGGFREGTKQDELGGNGILGLMWENINFEYKRCSAKEKGGRGNASRVWKNIPLDLFPWVNGWTELMQYREECGYPSTGRVFPTTYQTYLAYFHRTRKLCNGRISGEKETFRPHIFRKSHAQWCRKLRIPLEILAGRFPDASFGIGWDNLAIIMKYYADIEPDEYDEAQQKASARMQVLGLVI